MLISSSYHFAHARIVVRTFYGLYLKAFIITLTRLRHPIDHTSRNRVRSLYIRVIEAIDPSGQGRKAHHLLQFRQYAYTSLFRIKFVFLFQSVQFILAHILHRQIQQLFFVATKGYMHMQRTIKYLRNERNNHVLRRTLQTLSQLHHSDCQQFLFFFLHLAAILDCLTLYNGTVMDMQHGDIHFIILLVITKHIRIFCR